ncbi:MAG TPA: hypothetical protein VFU82_00700 [Gammaproteobacteria bacterium]|jgi:hypothetical protein|nr:hypothetical protein [Gammaproteobacteria bacterium]
MDNINQHHEQIDFDDSLAPVQLQLDFHPVQTLIKSPLASMTFFMQTLNLMLERKLASKLAPNHHR